MVTEIFNGFYTVFVTNLVPVLIALFGISIVFYAYRKLKGYFGGRR